MNPFFFLEAAQPQPETGGYQQTFIMILVLVVLFYFIIMRPESKRKKAEEAKRSSLQKGDKVTTVGGIVGTASKVEKDTVVLKMVDGSKVEFLKAAIAEVKSQDSKQQDAKEE